jgi:hypothetical protein
LNSGLLSIAPDDKPEPVTGGGPSSWQSLPWRIELRLSDAGKALETTLFLQVRFFSSVAPLP